MNQPPAPPYHAPQKKSGNGCLIALLILGLVVLSFVGLGTLGAYFFMTSKSGKEITDLVGKGAKAVGEAAKVMEEAARAPGMTEVRAIGCHQAFAIDLDKLMKAIDQFDAGLPARGSGAPQLMIVCTVKTFDAAPTCDAVARAYVGALGAAPGEFTVVVNKENDKASQCGNRYAANGKNLGAFKGTAPVIPGAP